MNYYELQTNIMYFFKFQTMVDVEIVDFTPCRLQYGCCDLIFTNIKDCLLLECAFNLLGTCISIWLMVLVWKKGCLDREEYYHGDCDEYNS